MIQSFSVRRIVLLAVVAAGALSLGACVVTPAPVAYTAPPPPTLVQVAPPAQAVAVQPAPATVAQVQSVQVQPMPRGLSDGNIAALIMDANSAEIRQAQLALSRSRNPMVRGYAQHIINDHTALNNALLQVASAQGIQPMAGRMAMRMQGNAQQTYNRLAALNGPAFDRAYMDAQIAMHRRVIHAMDQRLVPHTQNAQLRTAEQQARPALVAHLQHAQQIRARL